MKRDKDLTEGANIEILFVGRSNVGKSSLIRELTGKKVKIGKRPGVTLKPTHVRLGDLLVTDMPGFGFMSGVKDRKQDIVKDKIVRYIEENAKRIDLAVMVVDGPSFLKVAERWDSRNEIPIDIELYDFLQELDIDTILAVNKIDKKKPEEVDEMVDGVIERIGLRPPWKDWEYVVAPITVKKGNISAVKSLIRGRLHEAKRDDLFKYI